MTARRFLQGALPAAILGIFLIAAPHGASAAECQAQIDRELERIAVPAEAVESIQVMRRSRGAKSSSNFVYDAWIRLKSCESGYLMINMTSGCMVQQSYTSGDCRIEGLSGY